MKRNLFFAVTFLAVLVGGVFCSPKAHAQSWTEGATVAAGEYYLYNVGAQSFLNRGGTWSTHAVTDGQGVAVTLASSGGGYTIYTGVNSKYLEKGAYTDGTADVWTFESAVADGYTNAYKLKSSENKYLYWTGGGSGSWGNEVLVQESVTEGSEVNFYWLLIPKSTRQNWAGATFASPAEITYKITNPDFEYQLRDTPSKNDDSAKPWDPDNGHVTLGWTTSGFWRQNSAQTFTNGIFFEKWNGDGLTTADAMYQAVTLLSGAYRLTSTAHARCTQAYLFAGDDAEVNISDAGTYTVNFLVDSEKAVQLGVKIKDGGTGDWVAFDNFRLYYCGSLLQDGAASFTSGSAMTAGTWYKYVVEAESEYNFAAGSDLSAITYTTEGVQATENAAATNNFTNGQTLSVGTYYFKSSVAQTLSLIPLVKTYAVGAATTTPAASSYLQSLTTVVFDFSSTAVTNDDDASFTLLDNEEKAVLKLGDTPVAEGALSLEGKVLTATFSSPSLTANSTYTITLPAAVVGYAGHESNAVQNLTINTPAIFDGTYYYLYDATNEKFLSRGSSYGSHATVDPYGIPFNLTTDASNTSTVEFVDWAGKYLFLNNTNECYTDNNSTGWKFVKKEGGYYLKTADDARFAYVTDGKVNTTTTEGSATLWTLKSKAEHDAIVSAYPATNKSNVITAAGISTTADGFEAYLAANYAAKDKTASVGTAKFAGAAGSWTWTSVVGSATYGTDWTEAFEAAGTWSQTINDLPAGIYKVTVNGFERNTSYELCNTLGAAGYEIVTAYFKANDEQVQLASWYSEKTGTNDPDNTTQAATAFNNDKYKNTLYVYVADGGSGTGSLTLTVGKQDKSARSWVLFNNVTLTYYDTNVTDDEATAIIAEATTTMASPMKPSLYQALATAKTTFEGSQTVPNYNALRTAIDNTATSIASYAAMNTNYLDPVAALLESSNIIDLTSSAYTDYLAYKSKYDNYTNAETADIENATANAQTLWQGNGARYTNIANILMTTGWTINSNDALTNNSGFYANSWSTENDGVAPAKDFARPFYEMWVSSGSIAAATLSRTITGLTANTVYSVTANVRVQYSTKNAAITMQVGGGDAVDVTTGSKIGSTTRYIGSYTAYGQSDADGNLTIQFTVPANSGISWLSFRDVKYTKEANGAIAALSVKANKWGTFIAPFTVAIPAGLEAYKVTGVSGNYMVKEAVESAIPANTPVVLNNTTDALVSKTFYGISTAVEDGYTEGLLTGVYTAATIPVSVGVTTNYVLQTQGDVQAFYKVDADFTATPNRCYLTVTTGGGAKAFFFDDAPTAIAGVEADAEDNAPAYNVAGQPVTKDFKGIVIKNGKKFLQK